MIYFKVWNIICLLNTLASSLCYPYFMIAGIELHSHRFNWMIAFETIFLLEIGVNFFKQELDEEGNSKLEPLEVIAYRYLRSNFIIDTMVLIPWGFLF